MVNDNAGSINEGLYKKNHPFYLNYKQVRIIYKLNFNQQIHIYIYENSILYSLVATPTCVSHHIWRIWFNKKYIHGICDHTWTFVMICTLGM